MAVKPGSMSRKKINEFLSEPRNAVMGTIRKDGSPQLSTVWFCCKNDLIYTLSYNHSAKIFNIRRDPRVVICISGAHPDARSVTVYGTAELFDSSTALYSEINRELAHRYHETAEEAEAYMAEYADQDSSVVAITPDKTIGQDWN